MVGVFGDQIVVRFPMGFGLDEERFGTRLCHDDLSLPFPARTPWCKHWPRHASDTARNDFDQPVDCLDFQRLHLAWKFGRASTDQQMGHDHQCFSDPRAATTG